MQNKRLTIFLDSKVGHVKIVSSLLSKDDLDQVMEHFRIDESER